MAWDQKVTLCLKFWLHLKLVFVVVVVTPSLPRDGGTKRKAIQVRAINVIEISLGKMAAHFEPVLSDW